MSKEPSADELRQFLSDVLREMNIDTTSADDSTPLGPDGLDLESLAFAELALRVEDTYQVKFGDDEMEKLTMMTAGQFTDELAARILAVAEIPSR